MLYKERIAEVYNMYKKLARHYYAHNKIESCITCLYYACYVMYSYQIQLKDQEIEDLLQESCEKILGVKDILIKNHSGKIIMYDSLGNDNVALSMQYVTALTNMDVEFLYIFCGNRSNATRILKTVRESNNGRYLIIEQDESYSNRIRQLEKEIKSFEPEKAILHMANGDVVGAAVWSSIKGVERFFINHGDEQFWIGTNAFDYLICFRGMGVNTAIKYRGINKEKILILPYYPVISEVNFQGWDFEIPQNAVLIFSGGRFKKIYGENNEFSNMVSHILNENKNAFFLFAGSGDAEPFMNQLKKMNVSNRCRVISYRNDISELMKHIDLYLSTYPQSGGLMTQYAACAATPIVERDCMVGGVSEDLLPKLSPEVKITYVDLEEYYMAVHKLIDNEKLRKEIGMKIHDGLITQEEFEESFYDLLNCHYSKWPSNERISNVELRSERLIQADLNSIHHLYGLLINKYILRNKPIMFVKAACKQIGYFGFADFTKKVIKKFKGKN